MASQILLADLLQSRKLRILELSTAHQKICVRKTYPAETSFELSPKPWSKLPDVMGFVPGWNAVADQPAALAEAAAKEA